ncbi:hypothetical protein EV363DRAFT_1346178 [Boletus edulis]|uniref:Uncharacterized protein n=1 Tax=Boletus edulis BED1 TaxID=1328754 RepID=A0AAD4C8G0_BOLED|nr:hypothetical protein EV363DRAFT_1346178 [Boletus edulis]KAF8451908.1 hypothetical protein L210DRAFT_3514175 [Boletus edulis BED1]
MAPNLTSGTFNIVSLLDGNPASINLTLPGFQFVYLNGPVTTWVIEQEGDNTYRLRVGGYPYTGIIDKKVTASIFPEQNVEWIATYRELQDAYTISPINDTIMGWTVAHDDPNSKITLQHIGSTKSIPPRFFPDQLFRFEEVDE